MLIYMDIQRQNYVGFGLKHLATIASIMCIAVADSGVVQTDYDNSLMRSPRKIYGPAAGCYLCGRQRGALYFR
jgi:hypothetical protein